ncbi:unnamed protein product [Nippostrongylus brasiliensis]|uniref:F-box/LRR-repeat protein n=1 Tax=Nippostrongylus brasiliensis TaxID=27835 RepID=A0A0N4XI41_NIPBR|nr:unnamed protein product [Nippostrongylus brasiliensis]
MGIYESACDIDALALVSRAPHCASLRLDPCFTIDSVTTLLDCMRQIHELKYIRSLHKEIRSAAKTITADDTTIDALIPLSIACPDGLQSFWVDSISTDFSLAKMFELLEYKSCADAVLWKFNCKFVRKGGQVPISFYISQLVGVGVTTIPIAMLPIRVGHFSPRCSLLLEKVHGTETALRNWITENAQQVLYVSQQTYNFAYRGVEIGISVEQFVP